MSHDYSAIRNKHTNEYYKQYLYNPNEPRDDVSSDTATEFETELFENSRFLRRRFRQVAQNIRDSYTG